MPTPEYTFPSETLTQFCTFLDSRLQKLDDAVLRIRLNAVKMSATLQFGDRAKVDKAVALAVSEGLLDSPVDTFEADMIKVFSSVESEKVA